MSLNLISLRFISSYFLCSFDSVLILSNGLTDALLGGLRLVTDEGEVSGDYGIVTEYENSIWSQLLHLVWLSEHFVQGKCVRMVCIGLRVGTGSWMEFVTVVHGALAMARISFCFSANVRLLALQIWIDTRGLALFWQEALNTLKLAFNLLISQFKTLLTNLYLRRILDPVLQNLAHLVVELPLVGLYLLKLILNPLVLNSLLLRVWVDRINDLLSIRFHIIIGDLPVKIIFSLLFHLIFQVIDFTPLYRFIFLKFIETDSQNNDRSKQAES